MCRTWEANVLFGSHKHCVITIYKHMAPQPWKAPCSDCVVQTALLFAHAVQGAVVMMLLFGSAFTLLLLKHFNMTVFS